MGSLNGKQKINIKEMLERENAIKQANKKESDRITLQKALQKKTIDR